MTVTTSPVYASSIARFTQAQNKTWPRIARELATGHKESHWMWYVFPQLRGLARSGTAHYYGLRDKAEALAYLDSHVLRIRLAEATMAVLRHDRNMFGDTDRKKLRSCMTLFRELVTDPTLPDAVLRKFYGGDPCQLTLDILAGRPIPQQAASKPPVAPILWGGSAQGRVETRPRALWGDKPMSHRQIEAFLASLNLHPEDIRQIVDRWLEDQNCANQQGWDAYDAEHYS